MGKKDVVRPRVVCCAIPVARAAGKILLVTSRRHQSWVLPKGGWEPTDVTLEAAAQREAAEEAGVHGTITRFVVTIPSATVTYHFYELDVTGLLEHWPEAQERRREWVDFPEALRRLNWKPELAQALWMTSFAPRR